MVRAASSVNIIPTFTPVAPSIYEHIPFIDYGNPYIDPHEPDAPSLIVLCTWTGAQLRYIAKYTERYQFLFPSTRIMVITTTAKDLCFRGSKQKQERLRYAVDKISSLEYHDAGGSSASILMHVFSEGGSNKACELAEAYLNTTGRRLPVSALCLDSTPGHPRFGRLCNALGKSLPPIPVLRHASLFIATLLLGAVWITYNVIIGFDQNVITKTRERLLDTAHFDPTAPRCYLYSEQDALIAWQDVQHHAVISMECGIPVNDVVFEGSGHVGHARQEPRRYWDAVMATWQTAGALKEKSRFALLVEEIKSNEYKRWSDAMLLGAKMIAHDT